MRHIVPSSPKANEWQMAGIAGQIRGNNYTCHFLPQESSYWEQVKKADENAELLSKRILVSARMVGASGCVTASTGSRTSSAVRFLPSSSRACLLLVSYIPLAIPRATHRK